MATSWLGDTINGTLTELVNSILAEEDEILPFMAGRYRQEANSRTSWRKISLHRVELQ